MRPSTSASEMQDANQGEQATGCVDINFGFAFQTLLQQSRAFVVDAATGHVDGLDLAGRQLFHCVHVALEDLEVVFDHLPERTKPQLEFPYKLAVFL